MSVIFFHSLAFELRDQVEAAAATKVLPQLRLDLEAVRLSLLLRLDDALNVERHIRTIEL